MQWDQCRRFYNFLMADNMKKIILSHRYCSTSLMLIVLIGSVAVLDLPSWSFKIGLLKAYEPVPCLVVFR